MEATAGAARIEPAVCTAATHLPINHYTTGPGSMALVTILACRRRKVPSYVGKESLDIAPSLKVELLVGASLMCDAQARFPSQTLSKCALDVECAVSRITSHILRRPH